MTFQKDDLLTVTVIFVLKWQNPTYIPNFSVVVRVINLVRQCQYLTWKSPRSPVYWDTQYTRKVCVEPVKYYLTIQEDITVKPYIKL